MPAATADPSVKAKLPKWSRPTSVKPLIQVIIILNHRVWRSFVTRYYYGQNWLIYYQKHKVEVLFSLSVQILRLSSFFPPQLLGHIYNINRYWSIDSFTWQWNSKSYESPYRFVIWLEKKKSMYKAEIMTDQTHPWKTCKLSPKFMILSMQVYNCMFIKVWETLNKRNKMKVYTDTWTDRKSLEVSERYAAKH
jgi:hypothetical protein